MSRVEHEAARTLEALETARYPGGHLIELPTPLSRLLRTTHLFKTTRAAWHLFEERDGHRTTAVLLLSDGRFLVGGRVRAGASLTDEQAERAVAALVLLRQH